MAQEICISKKRKLIHIDRGCKGIIDLDLYSNLIKIAKECLLEGTNLGHSISLTTDPKSNLMLSPRKNRLSGLRKKERCRL